MIISVVRDGKGCAQTYTQVRISFSHLKRCGLSERMRSKISRTHHCYKMGGVSLESDQKSYTDPTKSERNQVKVASIESRPVRRSGSPFRACTNDDRRLFVLFCEGVWASLLRSAFWKSSRIIEVDIIATVCMD